MPDLLAMKGALRPAASPPTNPETALKLADTMVEALSASRTIGALHPEGALYLLQWRQSYARLPDKREKFDQLSSLRFGDLKLTGAGHITGKEDLPDGRVMLVPRGKTLVTCGCGCVAAVSKGPLQRRISVLESQYYSPISSNFAAQAPDTMEQPFNCPHITALLEEFLPQHAAVWRDLRNRVFRTNVFYNQGDPKPGSLQFDPEWFRRDLGLYNFVQDVGFPPGGQDGLWNHKLSRQRIRGLYLPEAFYWRHKDEKEKSADPKLLPEKVSQKRILYNRFYAAMQRARVAGLSVSWINWEEFYRDINSQDCPGTARLPKDFAADKYTMSFNTKEHPDKGMCLETLYWKKVSPRTSGGSNEDWEKGFKAGMQSMSEIVSQKGRFCLASAIRRGLSERS